MPLKILHTSDIHLGLKFASYDDEVQKKLVEAGSSAALLHGSELKTNPPFPEWMSRHSIAVGHPETVHRVEDLARQLHLNSLSSQGSTVFVPLAPTELSDGVDVSTPPKTRTCERRSKRSLTASSRFRAEHPLPMCLRERGTV